MGSTPIAPILGNVVRAFEDIMGTRYHYDRNGRYKGKTTDKPHDDGTALVVVFLLFFLLFVGGC